MVPFVRIINYMINIKNIKLFSSQKSLKRLWQDKILKRLPPPKGGGIKHVVGKN